MKGRALLTDLSGRKYVLDLSRGGVAKKLQSIVGGDDEDGAFSSGVGMKGMLKPGSAKFSSGKDKKGQPSKQPKGGTSTKEDDKCAKCRHCIKEFEAGGCNANGGVPLACMKCVQCIAAEANCG